MNVLRNQFWKQGKMSNAKLYSLSVALKEDLGTKSQSQIDHHAEVYNDSTKEDKADKLELACRYLKLKLSNNQRKYLNIPDSQWTKWRRMFCGNVKTRM